MAIKVLVVDDSFLVFKMIKRAIEPLEMEVVGHAENGKIALDMFEELSPDIVTLDMTMPIMDGLTTATHLLEKNPEAKIIFLSSIGDEDLLENARKIGIKHFIQKPINTEELVSAIDSLMSE